VIFVAHVLWLDIYSTSADLVASSHMLVPELKVQTFLWIVGLPLRSTRSCLLTVFKASNL
jgi:hypothetical protein